jgi:hypothetical protein
MALRGSTAADDAFGEESLTCHLQQFSLLQKLCVSQSNRITQRSAQITQTIMHSISICELYYFVGESHACLPSF